MDMEVEGGVKEERFGAGVYAHGFTKGDHNQSSYTWTNGKPTVANGELFGICEALNVDCEEGQTHLHICTDSMDTIHLIRKGLLMPWLLKGHVATSTMCEGIAILPSTRSLVTHYVLLPLERRHKELTLSPPFASTSKVHGPSCGYAARNTSTMRNHVPVCKMKPRPQCCASSSCVYVTQGPHVKIYNNPIQLPPVKLGLPHGGSR
jgi:hypothetical protein